MPLKSFRTHKTVKDKFVRFFLQTLLLSHPNIFLLFFSPTFPMTIYESWICLSLIHRQSWSIAFKSHHHSQPFSYSSINNHYSLYCSNLFDMFYDFFGFLSIFYFFAKMKFSILDQFSYRLHMCCCCCFFSKIIFCVHKCNQKILSEKRDPNEDGNSAIRNCQFIPTMIQHENWGKRHELWTEKVLFSLT